VIAITADGERLTCDGFFLGGTVCFGNFEFIANYFSGLSPSPGGATQAWLSWAQLAAGHQLHDGGELQPPLSQKARHGGFARSYCNHTMEGEHSGHDDGSFRDGGTAAGYRPPFRVTSRSSRGASGTSPRSAAHHRARGSL
jgi:hypothetical protein